MDEIDGTSEEFCKIRLFHVISNYRKKIEIEKAIEFIVK